MNLLIFFAIVLSTIILAIVLQRIIHCPILVGFAFFAAYLIVVAVFENTTYVIIAIILGIIAFFSAFIDCLIMNSNWLRNNGCINCNNNCSSNSNNNNNTDDDTLTIVNSSGEVVARINGNSVNCNNNNSSCGCSGRDTSALLASLNDMTFNNNTSGCCNRGYYRK